MGVCGPLLELDDIRRRLHLWSGSDAGIQAIEVSSIVGTVDRCCDFSRCFEPQRPELATGVKNIVRAFPNGDFPPIDVVQIDRAHFVVDGHKRVAAAYELGVGSIDAHVTRLPSPYSLDEWVDAGGLALIEAEQRFRTATGLRRVRIRCISPAAFDELIEAVKAHGYDLMQERGGLVPPAEAAEHWYEYDYLPTIAAGDAAGVSCLLSCCPDGELYLALHRQARALPDTDDRVAEAAEQIAQSQAPRPALGFLRRRR